MRITDFTDNRYTPGNVHYCNIIFKRLQKQITISHFQKITKILVFHFSTYLDVV